MNLFTKYLSLLIFSLLLAIPAQANLSEECGSDDSSATILCVGKAVLDSLANLYELAQTEVFSVESGAVFQLRPGNYHRLDSQGKRLGQTRIVKVELMANGDQRIYYHGSSDQLYETFRCRSDLNICIGNEDKAVLSKASSTDFVIGWNHADSDGKAVPSSIFRFSHELQEGQ